MNSDFLLRVFLNIKEERDNPISLKIAYYKPKYIFDQDDLNDWREKARKFEPFYNGQMMSYEKNPSFQAIVKPSVNNVRKDNPIVSSLTDSIAQVFFSPLNRRIVLNLYEEIITRMKKKQYICQNWDNIRVLVKGSTAMTLLFPYDNNFQFSDMDIIVSINPYLRNFDILRKIMIEITSQALSYHQKVVSNMFVMTNPNDMMKKHFFLTDHQISTVKREYGYVMKKFADETIFSDITVRNKASRNSFEILPHAFKKDHVVLIDVPFFDKCNMIPLLYSPIYATKNDTIDYTEEINGEIIVRRFTLFRLKINNLIDTEKANIFLEKKQTKNQENVLQTISSSELSETDQSSNKEYEKEDENKEDQEDKEDKEDKKNNESTTNPKINTKVVNSKSKKYDKEFMASAEFIDISIPDKTDTLAKESWDKDNTIWIKDVSTGIHVQIPDIKALIRDLENLLYKYQCPEEKKTKRESMLNRLYMYTKKYTYPHLIQ